jgi:23S rRNA maturation mini-RNase III
LYTVTTYVSAPGDAEVMQRMKETIDTQRDVIRSRNLEIESQKADVDAVGIYFHILHSVAVGLLWVLAPP